MNGSSRIKILLVVLLASGVLAACGKRGALEPPPGAPKSETEQKQGDKKKEGPAAPKRSLPIDFILD